MSTRWKRIDVVIEVVMRVKGSDPNPRRICHMLAKLYVVTNM